MDASVLYPRRICANPREIDRVEICPGPDPDPRSLSLSAAPAVAAFVAWDPPITISSLGEPSLNPQLVTDGTTITAVWQSYDGSFDRIVAASSTDDGLTWTAPVTLSDPGGTADAAQLVTDGTTITATWARHDGSNFRIQTASSTDGGTTWSTPVTLSDAGEDASVQQLVTDGTTITATWNRNDGSNFRIQTANSTDGGTTWSTPVTLSDAGEDAWYPQLVTDGTTITAAWERNDGGPSRIQIANSTDGGTTWSAPVSLSDPGGDAFDPQLVTDGTTITVIWRFDSIDARIHTANSTDGGTTWSTLSALSNPGGEAAVAQLVTDGTTITVIWHFDDNSDDTRIEVSSFTFAEVEPEPEPELAATGPADTMQLSVLALSLLLGGGILLGALGRPSTRQGATTTDGGDGGN